MKTVAANTQGQRRSPPDPTRGRDLTAPLHAAIPGHIDGFQRAILLEEHALRDAITAENRELQGRLAPLVAEIYAQLRTPIYPKGGYLALAQALVNAVAGDKRCMYLHAVPRPPLPDRPCKLVQRMYP